MARPKSKAASKGAAKAGRNRAGEKPTAITIKGALAWRDWVDRGASFCRTDVAKLIDSALVEYLKGRGFTEEAPER